MRIALISFEYPIDTPWGGIATYVQQAAKMLHQAGYDVEVFAGTKKTSYNVFDEGIKVHLVNFANRMKFYEDVFPVFAKEHQAKAFDILEVPEYATDARLITQAFPEVARVVKAHSPNYLNTELNTSQWTIGLKLLYVIKTLRQRRRPNLPILYDYKHDTEYQEVLKADVICTPSVSLLELIQNKWNLKSNNGFVLPNPLVATQELLSLQPSIASRKTVAFFGRLEIRKGILDLGQAIPLILKHEPDTQFYLVGQVQESPQHGMNMQEFLSKKLKPWLNNIHFVGKVNHSEITSWLDKVDICVFPSIWENFPNVCLEAMAAARAIVASSSGGMLDMLEDESRGILIPPKSPESITQAVLKLIKNHDLAIKMGTKAREKLLASYSYEAICPQQIQMYEYAMKMRDQRLGIG